MAELDFVFDALRDANPVPTPGGVDAHLHGGHDVLVGDQIQGQLVAAGQTDARRARRPFGFAAVVAVTIVIAGFVVTLAMIRSGDERIPPADQPTTPSSVTATSPNGATVDTICDIRAPVSDPNSTEAAAVERFYVATLANDLLRRELAPIEIAREADVVATDMSGIVEELEAAGWDVGAVDTTRSAEAIAALVVIDSYVAEHCP